MKTDLREAHSSTNCPPEGLRRAYFAKFWPPEGLRKDDFPGNDAPEGLRKDEFLTNKDNNGTLREICSEVFGKSVSGVSLRAYSLSLSLSLSLLRSTQKEVEDSDVKKEEATEEKFIDEFGMR